MVEMRTYRPEDAGAILALWNGALEADKAAMEFARHFLPEALKTLPMSSDMAKLGGD